MVTLISLVALNCLAIVVLHSYVKMRKRLNLERRELERRQNAVNWFVDLTMTNRYERYEAMAEMERQFIREVLISLIESKILLKKDEVLWKEQGF